MKKIVAIVLAAALSIACISTLAGCESDSVYAESGYKYERAQDGPGVLQRIDGNLYYDTDTRIVYYTFAEVSGYKGFGFMAPYYSENGKLCRYKGGSIVEIDADAS